MTMRGSLVVLLAVTVWWGCASRGEPAQCDDSCAAAKGWPVATYRAQPTYPEEAAARSIGGCVVVSFEITPGGVADRYQVLDSKPPGVFDMATLEALNDWRFKVPERPGRYAQRIDYRMANAPAPAGCIEVPGFDALNRAKVRGS
jgi:TonB family protein